MLRLEAGVGLGGVHPSVGVARTFDCPHMLHDCLSPYLAPEIYRAAWLTNWAPRTYAGAELGLSIVLLKLGFGMLHPLDAAAPWYWQVRAGFGW